MTPAMGLFSTFVGKEAPMVGVSLSPTCMFHMMAKMGCLALATPAGKTFYTFLYLVTINP